MSGPYRRHLATAARRRWRNRGCVVNDCPNGRSGGKRWCKRHCPHFEFHGNEIARRMREWEAAL